ncbi:hypothetical protein HPP92_004889 [Vanilla planifolia]|uniref:Tetraspanin-2 n=1 Tax=Vanilla planifolia TaxID=51239 RepID=A0A835RKC2_VANPL|nr:hypothetical protein HPP92_004889 [Vanilla planifolia]
MDIKVLLRLSYGRYGIKGPNNELEKYAFGRASFYTPRTHAGTPQNQLNEGDKLNLVKAANYHSGDQANKDTRTRIRGAFPSLVRHQYNRRIDSQPHSSPPEHHNLRQRLNTLMGVSNNIIAVLNFVAFLCSIPIISSGIWLASKPDNECVHLVRWPVIILGVLILLVSLAGFVGAYWNHQCLLAAYLFFMATLIVLLLALLVFAFVVTRPDGSYAVPGRVYKEYRLSGFSNWLRHYVADNKNWNRIRACLSQSDICGKLARDDAYFTVDQFLQSDLSPLQASSSIGSNDTKFTGLCEAAQTSKRQLAKESGCCKPPSVCGYSYVNPTVWVNPVNPVSDPDCSAWSNDQMQLCYGCNSCKAGMIGNLRHEWRKANIALIVAAVALIWVYVIGCCALKNAQTEELFSRYKQGFA